MKTPKFLLAGIFAATSIVAVGQACPFSEATFVAGGSFSGTCTLDVGSNVTIPVGVAINWTGGTLTIRGPAGSNGALIVNGTLNLTGGSILVNDGNNSDVTIGTNGTLYIAPSTSLTCDESITVHGDLTIEGSLTSTTRSLTVSTTGDVVISNSGSLTTNGAGDNLIQGTMTSNGAFATNGDFEIGGGTVTVQSGTFELTKDLWLFDNGSLIIGAAAVVNVTEDIGNGVDDGTPTPTTNSGGITLIGELNGGGDLVILDTDMPAANESFLNGTGQLTIQGSISDAECADYADGLYAFCHCTGGGITCNGALPITLTDFSGQQTGNVILLKWTTETEINNHIFTIERLTTEDAFEPVSTVPGSGTTHMPHHYQAFDATPVAGKNYYRLRQTDYDGATTTSELIMVEFERMEVSYSVYPNPTRDNKFTIDVYGLEPEQEVLMTLKTSQGAIVLGFRQKTDLSGNIHKEVEVPIKGFYLLDVAGKPVKIIVE